jgi:hypothetical protein
MTANSLAVMLLDNVGDINIGNLLKSQEKIKLKETEIDKVDLIDLLDAIREECMHRCHLVDDNCYYADVALLSMQTKRYLAEHTSANKAHVFDRYLFYLRELTL